MNTGEVSSIEISDITEYPTAEQGIVNIEGIKKLPYSLLAWPNARFLV